MKKIYTLILAVSSLAATAQTTNTFPASGNVGIGTDSPQYRFQMLGYHGDTNLNLRYYNPDPTKQADLTLWASEPGLTYNGGGIGNNVYNNPAGGIARINGSKGGSYIRLLDQELKFNIVGSGGTDISAMTIAASGNVGIGTTSPTELLTVSGMNPIHGTFLTLDDQAITDRTGVRMRFQSRGIAHWNMGIPADVDAFTINGWSGATNPEYFRINSNGNVGIGVTSPTDKLAVNGNIRAKEIKVETANWPDYVFAKDYQLPTLQETEQHIKDKGHLPGIPSASEVKANGVDLGEMNAKLLQKIEELTLHLIEQNSRNQKQDAIIEKQQNEINQLKNKLSIP